MSSSVQAAADSISSLNFDSSVSPAHYTAIRRALDGIAAPCLAGSVEVAVLSGGGSNENFLVSVDGERHCVLRLTAPADTSRRFRINRVAGLEAHLFAQAAGLSPELLGITLPSGDSLTRFLNGPTVGDEDVTDGTTIEDCIALLRSTHRNGRSSHQFSATQDILAYAHLAELENLSTPSDLREMIQAASRIESHFQQLELPVVLCHNDATTANFLRCDGRLWLLDWEYSGMGNPYFDLAYFVAAGELEHADVDRVLASYFGALRDCDRARLRAQRVVAELREAIWAVVAGPVLGGMDFDHQERADDYFDRARRSMAALADSDFSTCGGAQDDDPAVFGEVFGGLAR